MHFVDRPSVLYPSFCASSAYAPPLDRQLCQYPYAEMPAYTRMLLLPCQLFYDGVCARNSLHRDMDELDEVTDESHDDESNSDSSTEL